MTTIGFTGTRDLPPEAWAALRQQLATLEAAEFVTGACAGVDAFVGDALVRLFPEARHMVLVPQNRASVDRWWLRLPADLLACVEFEFPSGGYKGRNQAIVDASTRLVAVPVAAEDHPDQRRSGTWQTVRMARRKGIPADVWMISDLIRVAS